MDNVKISIIIDNKKVDEIEVPLHVIETEKSILYEVLGSGKTIIPSDYLVWDYEEETYTTHMRKEVKKEDKDEEISFLE